MFNVSSNRTSRSASTAMPPPPYSISNPIKGHRCQCRCGSHLDPAYELNQRLLRLVPVQASSDPGHSAPPSYREVSSFPAHQQLTAQSVPKDNKKNGTPGQDNSTDANRTASPKNRSDLTVDGDDGLRPLPLTADQEQMYGHKTMHPSREGRDSIRRALRRGRLLLSGVACVTGRAAELSLYGAYRLLEGLAYHSVCYYPMEEKDPRTIRQIQSKARKRWKKKKEERLREHRLTRQSLKSRFWDLD
ncbi:hypothetical protein B0J18DRAFT_425135 [Chaetomium sp. MPI-SDFR-AT-0129]|nr:hypothetical protein B0J18DRAFT_425135 [Chaetomium sp. MPI-SDFR-AT-0129]